MQSWNLTTFVDKHGLEATGRVWGVSHQAVSKAIYNERQIQIVKIEGFYEVHESKLLNKVAIDEVIL